MSSIINNYVSFINRRPFLGNAISTALLFGSGDSLAQLLFPLNSNISTLSQFDPIRTIRGMIYGGIIFSPIGWKWYRFLQNRISFPIKLNAKNNKNHQQKLLDTIARVAVDQLIWAPIGVPLYFTAMTLMEGEGLNSIKKKLNDKYYETLITNWKVWPTFQLANFYFIPLDLRLFSVNFVSIFWNCYMSY
ncbi:hypothetical protein CANARDRAFT_215735, partial [[Candida] arabinofermentans NRRL YB-2248]